MAQNYETIKDISAAIDAISESGQTYFKNKRGMVPSRADTVDIVKKIQSVMFPDYFVVEQNFGVSTEDRLDELLLLICKHMCSHLMDPPKVHRSHGRAVDSPTH